MATRLARVLATSLFLAGLAGGAASQELDDAWLELTIRARTETVSPAGEVTKGKERIKAYVHFVADGGEGVVVSPVPYDTSVFCETAPGVWTQTSLRPVVTVGSHEEILMDPFLSPTTEGVHWQVATADGAVLQLVLVARLKLVFAKTGELSKVRFKGFGGHVPYGELDNELVVGDCQVTGRLVAPEKLPFEI